MSLNLWVGWAASEQESSLPYRTDLLCHPDTGMKVCHTSRRWRCLVICSALKQDWRSILATKKKEKL